MRRLVTGSDGFIGRHLVHALGDTDQVDRTTHGALQLGRSYGSDVDVVYHLAACGDINAPEGVHFGDTFAATSIAIAIDPKRFVFTSSGAVYGDGKLPISVYGACKLGAEGLVNAWAYRTGKHASILRLGNVVGPGCRGVIPDTLRKLKANPRELTVLGNGVARKPFVHVSDVVNVILEAPKGVHDVRHWTTTSVRDVIYACCEVVGAKPIIEWGETIGGWPGDIPTPHPFNRDDMCFAKMTSDEAVHRAVAERWEEIRSE